MSHSWLRRLGRPALFLAASLAGAPLDAQHPGDCHASQSEEV